MDDFADRMGMTKSGLLIVVVLVAAIVGVYFLLPDNKPKPVRVAFDLEKAQADQAAKEAGQGKAAPAPAAPAKAAAAPTVEAAALNADITEVSMADVRKRLGRVNPFLPVEPLGEEKEDKDKEKDKDKKKKAVESSTTYSDEFYDFGSTARFDYSQQPYMEPRAFPETDIAETSVDALDDLNDYFTPNFSLTTISTGRNGRKYAIINGEIVEEGQRIPGTNYIIESINTDHGDEVVLRNVDDKNMKIPLVLKRSFGRFTIEPSADGKHLRITNVQEDVKPPEKTDSKKQEKKAPPKAAPKAGRNPDMPTVEVPPPGALPYYGDDVP